MWCMLNQAVEAKRLFVVDYRNIYMPYVKRFNEWDDRKIYATRALFFLLRDEFLTLVAIELSLPPFQPGAVGLQRGY